MGCTKLWGLLWVSKMNINVKLSIIVPVYNAEKYLPRCIDSILANGSPDIEVLLVNDGSKDNSENICRMYAQEDPRVKLIDQNNSGVSVARNNGIFAASGEYIMFLDADDYLVANYWDMICEEIKKDYDFVGFSNFSLNCGKIHMDQYPNFYRSSESLNDARQILMGTHLLHTCWGKLYKREIIKKERVTFPEGIKIGEDYLFVAQYFKYVRYVKLVNDPLLYYCINEDSVMQKNYDAELRYHTWRYLTNFCMTYYQEQGFCFDSVFYTYLFKNTTSFLYDLFRNGSVQAIRRFTEYVIAEPLWKQILQNVDAACLGKLKKIEYQIFSSKKYWLIFAYFKLKSKFKKS